MTNAPIYAFQVIAYRRQYYSAAAAALASCVLQVVVFVYLYDNFAGKNVSR